MIGSLWWSTFKASVIRPLLSKPVIKKISKRIKAESFWAFAFSYHFLRRYWKKGERIRFSRGRKCSLKQMKSLISVSVKLDDFAFLSQNDVKKGRKKLKKVSPSTSSGWVVPFVLEKWKLTSLQKPSSRKLFLLGTFWGALYNTQMAI